MTLWKMLAMPLNDLPLCMQEIFNRCWVTVDILEVVLRLRIQCGSRCSRRERIKSKFQNVRKWIDTTEHFLRLRTNKVAREFMRNTRNIRRSVCDVCSGIRNFRCHNCNFFQHDTANVFAQICSPVRFLSPDMRGHTGSCSATILRLEKAEGGNFVQVVDQAKIVCT